MIDMILVGVRLVVGSMFCLAGLAVLKTVVTNSIVATKVPQYPLTDEVRRLRKRHGIFAVETRMKISYAAQAVALLACGLAVMIWTETGIIWLYVTVTVALFSTFYTSLWQVRDKCAIREYEKSYANPTLPML